LATIAVVGALDTKGAEFAYLVELIHARGHQTITLDTGVIESPHFTPDIDAGQVAQAGGSPLDTLRRRADRGEALRVMAAGTTAYIRKLFDTQKIAGIIGMGGSGGTSIFAAAVQALPVGFPKVLVTTMASGDTRSIVGVKDLVLFPSVVDIAGLNRISRQIIQNAAGAICGMVDAGQYESMTDKPLIAATMLGNTTQAIGAAREILEAAGYEVLVFHAIGVGGQTMEGLIADGLIAGVLDLTTTELVSEYAGSPMGAGPDRMRAAARHGIPQVIVPGCFDFAIFRRPESIPGRYAERSFYSWNTEATLMRTTPEENQALGCLLAERANQSKGHVAVALPLRGLSLLDVEGQPFWWPEADTACFEAIRSHLRPDIPLIELDTHINDPDFGRQTAETLLSLIDRLPWTNDKPY
jgi:uncharacterized protein (UPF0261 family)